MNGTSSALPTPSWRDRIVTFYRGPRAVVTTEFFEANGFRYPLEELRWLHRVERIRWLRPQLYELWARFRGRTIRLFRCRNGQEFGQVHRALVRALEHAGLS